MPPGARSALSTVRSFTRRPGKYREFWGMSTCTAFHKAMTRVEKHVEMMVNVPLQSGSGLQPVGMSVRSLKSIEDQLSVSKDIVVGHDWRGVVQNPRACFIGIEASQRSVRYRVMTYHICLIPIAAMEIRVYLSIESEQRPLFISRKNVHER